MLPPLTFSRNALREIDRRAVAEFHIPILVLMENAGRAVAHAALHHLKPASAILIIAGPGNNGADALVAARHLHNMAHRVEILSLFDPHKIPPDSPLAHQLAIVHAMKLPLHPLSADHSEIRDWIVDSQPQDVVIDGLFGTGLSREVTGLAAEVIRAVNLARRSVIAIDIPSGLDADTGQPAGNSAAAVAIRAAETVSFCGSKIGFTAPASHAFLGKLTIADIGVPRELLAELAVKTPSPSAK